MVPRICFLLSFSTIQVLTETILGTLSQFPTTILLGAPYANGAGSDSGKAYIFDVTTGSLLQTLNNPNAYSTAATDYFGQSVAISGNRVVVGAHGEDDAGGTDSGKAYIYTLY